MPSKPRRPCSYPGCGILTVNGRCDKHKREPWQRTHDVKRMTGRKLQKERALLFAENPLCVECEKVGIVRAATQRDHIVPLAEGGLDVRENTQGLCDECHAVKVKEESKRGRAKSRW